MVHHKNRFTIFLPESVFPTKKIPPGFIANDGTELSHACCKYILTEKVYLNPLFKHCIGFITWVPSTTQAGEHFYTPVLQLVKPGREMWLTFWVTSKIHKPSMDLLMDLSSPMSSAGAWGSTVGAVTLSLRSEGTKIAVRLPPCPLPSKPVPIQGHHTCLHVVTKSGQMGNPHGWWLLAAFRWEERQFHEGRDSNAFTVLP